MIKITIEMPNNAQPSGNQSVEVSTVPRVGELIKEMNNKYYRVTEVIYQPFEQSDSPKIVIRLNPTFVDNSVPHGAKLFSA